MTRKAKPTEQAQPHCVCGGQPPRVLSWMTSSNDYRYPDVGTLAITLVEFPVAYYQHLDYGPEVMEARTKRIKELHWASESMDLSLPPTNLGTYPLLSAALQRIRRDAPGATTVTEVVDGCGIRVRCVERWLSTYAAYLNHSACEFYRWLFYQNHGRVIVDPAPRADIGTLPKILKWVRKFETNKRRQYRSLAIPWVGEKPAVPDGATIQIVEATP